MKMNWKKPTDRTIKRAYLVVAITVAAVLLCCPMVLAKTPLESIKPVRLPVFCDQSHRRYYSAVRGGTDWIID